MPVSLLVRSDRAPMDTIYIQECSTFPSGYRCGVGVHACYKKQSVSLADQ